MPKFAKREGIMLAHPADQKRVSNFPLMELADGSKERKFFHQPKLNGERARIEWFDREPYLISSYGNAFKFLDDIKAQLSILSNELHLCYKFDGEIYKHGWSRERIDSALRRTKNKNPETCMLEYHIFDYQTEDINDLQYNRLHTLGFIEQTVNRLGLQNIKIVPYGICSEVDWVHHCGCYCEEGYEGVILRNPFGSYVTKRSPDLLKFKPTETDTYKIVAVNEATTSDTNEPKGMVGSFTVIGDDGVIFDVGAGKLTHDKRLAYWRHRADLLNKMLLVKHELLKTTGQVPIAAVTVDVVI